jgi:flagellin-like hook-associated protein FlgL
MASDITLSKGVRSNLLSLQNTAELLNRTQERLATGKKVNSALDNPINFFTSSGLSARANDLSRLLDSVGNAVQTLQAADKGISAITKLIESAQATAKQALVAAEGTLTYDTTIEGTAVLDADGDVAAVPAGDLDITVDGVTTTITFGGASMDTLAELNAALGGIAGVTASVPGATDFVTIAWTTDSSVTIGGDAAVLAALGLDAGTTQAAVDTVTTPSEARASLEDDYNNLLTQITQLAGDASFNGVNLLDSDSLEVVFNEDGTSSLTINGVDFSATGLGITATTGNGFQDDANIDAALDQLEAAVTTLRTQASAFGSNLSIVQTRQDFTKNMISVLQIGADNLVLADTNEEGANMLALNTRQQLSTVALSLAAQADQNVLQLF